LNFLTIINLSMKKILLVFAAIGFVSGSIAQNRPSSLNEIKERLNRTGHTTPVKIQDVVTGSELPSVNTNPTVKNYVTNLNKTSAAQVVIGSTTYDLQSNGSVQNRIYKKNGNVGASWTGSTDLAGSYADRGTWYNYFNGSSWNPAVNSRLETDRRGWPSLVQLANGNEVVVSHGSLTNPTATNIRSNPGGAGGWTQTAIPAFPNGENTLWARTAAGGPDGNTLHMIDITYPTGNGGALVNGLNGCLSYSRSLDGGQSWDVVRVLPPGVNDQEYNGFRADAYAIDAKDNVVAFVSGNITDDWALWKSTDNGTTWTRTVIWDFPFTKYDDVTQTTDVDGDGVSDTLLTTDGAYAIVIDNNGIVHAFAGAMLVIDSDPAANLGLFLSTDGLLYWNETFGGNDPVVIATAPDIDGDGVAGTFATNLGGRYGNDGICSMPSAAIDASGNLFVSYSALMELTDNALPAPNNFSFRNVLMKSSADGGNTWSDYYNVSNSDFDEAVFCALARNVDGCVSMIWQQDGSPGYSVPTNGQHAIGNNDIIYDCVDVNLLLGISQANENVLSDLNVFPNPVSGMLTVNINVSKQTDLKAEIRNIMGQTVSSIQRDQIAVGTTQFGVDVSSLSIGVYTISVVTGNNVRTVKFVKK